MLFTTGQFLIFFSALMALLLLFKGNTARFRLILGFSLLFYAVWKPPLIILLLLMSLWGWGFGFLVANSQDSRRRRFYLACDVVLTLGTLAFFKYANFLGESFSWLLHGPGQWSPFDIVLPIGISFFSFHNMSYVIDIYRRTGHYCPRFDYFLLYMSFFPQLIAGPIVRAKQFLPQLDRPILLTRENAVAGGQVFLIGVFQKMALADNLGLLVDGVFAQPALYSTSTLWLAVLAYAGQIFCDFSGYTLMALGLAQILGFTLPPNFRMPYLSQSIADFWRRWHMSLSFWLRDYLYVSLGGSRQGAARTYAALMVTMLLGGLWHGASWNFVVWGGLHGLALSIHRIWAHATSQSIENLRLHKVYQFAAWSLTITFVIFAWIPFRSPDFATTREIMAGLFSDHPGIDWHHPQSLIVLLGLVVWHLWSQLTGMKGLPPYTIDLARGIPALSLLGIMALAVALFAPLGFSPFIYFQF